ncbi:MAG: arginine--tRNA ligase [Mycoplasmoidaceae bacterium]
MNKTIICEINDIFEEYLEKNNIEKVNFIVEKTKNNDWGDFSTNIALVLAKNLKKNPIELAEEISKNISSNKIKKIEVTKPGFINLFLSDEYYNHLLKEAIQKEANFGQFNKKNIYYNIEFVSANPTGSLHIGHARNAALGSTLANIWEKYGISVDREYYINDGGAQINRLGVAVLIRYKELFNIKNEMPEDSYHGEEPKWVAKELKDKYNDRFLNTEFDSVKITNIDERKIINDFSKIYLMEKIKETLSTFRVHFDFYYPESKIFDENLIEVALNKLKNYTYEKDGALWLRTTDFNDDKDRVLIKSDKEVTYFMPDICYHYEKLKRKNYDKIFDILGADHGSYIVRIAAACNCLGYKDKLNGVIMQMVKLTKDGEPFKMSKRSGQSLTLNDLIESIGVDSARWNLVSQSANSHLEIDVAKAKSTDSSNPIYYVMYANARITKVLASSNSNINSIDSSLLSHQKERELLNAIAYYPCLIDLIANNCEIHLLNSYLLKLAAMFHSYYSDVKIISDDKNISKQRLNLINAIKSVIASGLKIMEIIPLDKI